LNFTYDSYEKMLSLLKDNKYQICNYENYLTSTHCVILRHDVDLSLEKALKFAKLEYKNKVQATYFILLSTGFYNIFDKKAYEIINWIRDLGHDIGLHFDEARYPINSKEDLVHNVKKEIFLMSNALEMKIKTVSMHRPSKLILDGDVEFDHVINSYSHMFFNEFKYLSDSGMRWREDVLGIIRSNAYDRLHILTHPIWYGETEASKHERLYRFMGYQNGKTYDNMKDNISNLEEVLPIKIDLRDFVI
jgi:hypothetical protein